MHACVRALAHHSGSISSNPSEEWTCSYHFPRRTVHLSNERQPETGNLPHLTSTVPTHTLCDRFLNFFLVYLPTSIREFQLYTRVSGPNFSPCLIQRLCLDSFPTGTLKTQSSRPPGIYRYQHPGSAAVIPLAYLPGFKMSWFWLLRSFLACLFIYTFKRHSEYLI